MTFDYSAESCEALRKYLAVGLSVSDIARNFDCSTQLVRGWIKSARFRMYLAEYERDFVSRVAIDAGKELLDIKRRYREIAHDPDISPRDQLAALKQLETMCKEALGPLLHEAGPSEQLIDGEARRKLLELHSE